MNLGSKQILQSGNPDSSGCIYIIFLLTLIVIRSNNITKTSVVSGRSELMEPKGQVLHRLKNSKLGLGNIKQPVSHAAQNGKAQI